MGQVIKLNLMVLTILVALLLIAAIVINTPQAHAIAISVESSPAGQGFIKVDGTPIETPQSYNWATGSKHTLDANPEVIIGNHRYLWLSWSNGEPMTQIYTVPGKSSSITAFYQTQYYLAINSEYGSAEGEGYYNEMEIAHFSITSPIDNDGVRHIVTGFSGDASGTTSCGSITMDAPKTITFNWKTQYQVAFNSNPYQGGTITSTTSEAGYYDEGATISIAATANDGYIFEGWVATQGIVIADPTSSSTTATINSPGTITANYQPQIIPTSLSLTCNPTTADHSATQIDITAKLTQASDLNKGISGKTLTISYFDGLYWQPIVTATTDDTGTCTYRWTPPSTLTYGPHPIKVTFNGDPEGSAPRYLPSSAETDGRSDGGGIFILPEYTLGTLASLIACICGFILFKRQTKCPRG